MKAVKILATLTGILAFQLVASGDTPINSNPSSPTLGQLRRSAWGQFDDEFQAPAVRIHFVENTSSISIFSELNESSLLSSSTRPSVSAGSVASRRTSAFIDWEQEVNRLLRSQEDDSYDRLQELLEILGIQIIVFRDGGHVSWIISHQGVSLK